MPTSVARWPKIQSMATRNSAGARILRELHFHTDANALLLSMLGRSEIVRGHRAAKGPLAEHRCGKTMRELVTNSYCGTSMSVVRFRRMSGIPLARKVFQRAFLST